MKKWQKLVVVINIVVALISFGTYQLGMWMTHLVSSTIALEVTRIVKDIKITTDPIKVEPIEVIIRQPMEVIASTPMEVIVYKGKNRELKR